MALIDSLCPPALIYICFSLTQIIIDLFKGLFNIAFFKFWIMIIFTLLLNILCSRGLGIISWILVFVPFMLMSVITAILLFTFGLDPRTGKIWDTNFSKKKHHRNDDYDPYDDYDSYSEYDSGSDYDSDYDSDSDDESQPCPPGITPEMSKTLYGEDCYENGNQKKNKKPKKPKKHKKHKKHPNPDFTKCKPGCDIKPSLDGNCDDDIKKGPNGKCFKTCYSGCSNRTFSDTKCNYDSDCKDNCPSMKVYHGVSCDNQKPPVPVSTSAKKFVENLSISR